MIFLYNPCYDSSAKIVLHTHSRNLLEDKRPENKGDNTDNQKNNKDYPNPVAPSIEVTNLILVFKHFGYLLPVRSCYVLLGSLGSPLTLSPGCFLLLTEELDTPMPGKNSNRKIIKKAIPKAFA